MANKIFALATISALMCAAMAAGAAGCSSNDDPVPATDDDAGVKDAGRDRALPNDEEDPPPESCASKEAVDATKLPYTKALKSPGACTSDEVKALIDYFDKTDQNKVSIAAWSATVSDTCAACAFTPTTAEKWGPLVYEGDKLSVANRGGCIELASEKESCGRAYEQVLRCPIVACLPTSQGGFGTCSSQAEFDECRGDTTSLYEGPCAGAMAAVQQECGTSLSAAETACKPAAGAKYIFEATIPAHCGGEPTEDPDAGTGDGGNED